MCGCKQTNRCNPKPCAPEPRCDCPVKDLSTDCSTYTGEDLECSGIKKGTILTELLQQLDAFICQVKEDLQKLFSLLNVGTGAEVYKGVDLLGRKEIRTITKTGDLLEVTENVDDINLTINETVLNTFIEDNQKTYSVENVGTGAGVYKSPDIIVGDNTQFNIRTIASDNLEIIQEENTIKINTPVSTSNLAFYVDVNSTANSEAGNLSAPFKTINKALDTFIGTGTWYNPQYKGYKITLLSSCSLLEIAGADYNGYTNLDVNNLNIEGSGFYLGLYANPEIDYYPISTRRMVTNMPKTAGVLDYDIDLRFNNVILQRAGTNAIVDHLNYSFPTADINVPTFPPQQNGSRIWITESTLTNDTNRFTSGNFSVVPNPNDGGNPLLMFGVPVYTSNTEPIGVPMIKSEGRAWNKEGELKLGNSRLVNLSGTALKFVNTTYSDFYKTNEITTNNYFKLYETEVDDYYSPKLGLYLIDLEDVNYMVLNSSKINWTQPRMTTTELIPRSKIIGGAEAIFKLNNSTLNINENSSDQEGVENLVQMDGTSWISLDGYHNNGQVNDIVHGAIKVTAPLPLIAKELNIQNSVLFSVIVDETGVDKSFIKQINGDKNRINNAPHSSYLSYVDDVAAKAAGLIRGNIYYNTTVGALKQIL